MNSSTQKVLFYQTLTKQIANSLLTYVRPPSQYKIVSVRSRLRVPFVCSESMNSVQYKINKQKLVLKRKNSSLENTPIDIKMYQLRVPEYRLPILPSSTYSTIGCGKSLLANIRCRSQKYRSRNTRLLGHQIEQLRKYPL